MKENLSTIAQCADFMRIFLGDTIEIPEAEYDPNLFKILYNMFSKIEDLTPENVKDIFSNAQKETGITGKRFYAQIRLVLTGMDKGPELMVVIPLIGKEKILKRLERAHNS